MIYISKLNVYVGGLMLVIIAIVSIILLVLYIQHTIQHTIQQKYNDFVNQNSMALKKLMEINQQYAFYPYIDFNQTHTYDNEKFYDNISCSDYLIYQLQYLSPKIFDQVKKVDSNKQKYQKLSLRSGIYTIWSISMPDWKTETRQIIKYRKKHG